MVVALRAALFKARSTGPKNLHRVASEVWRGLGIEVVRSAAELKLSRISVMRGDFTAAEVRRGKGRASWYERRHYRARRDGFARAQHFNQAGARRNHK